MTDVVAGAATDTGVVREQNEDAVATWGEQSPHVATNGRLFALADGMGGHSRGEVASAEAVRVLFERFYQEPAADIALALKQAFRQANERIYQDGAANGPEQMMGTTLVAGVIRDNVLTIANVGDSRAYLLRGGGITQITRDHSVVAEQVKAGKLTAEQARTSRNRNVITRALGHQQRVEVDIFDVVPLLPRDGILLASDGLYHTFSEAELAELALADPPGEAAAALVRLARERQSSDNASAVIVHYERAATAALPVAGRDLFDTAELPRREPVAARGPAPALIAAAIAAALIIVLIVVLLLSGMLPF